MELTKFQEKIINAPEPLIAVEAAAAALKTSTLIEKVRKTLQDGYNPNEIAVITFTRMAAQELVERLGDDYKDGIFVGTIHALAAKFLVEAGLFSEFNEAVESEEFDELFELCQKIGDISNHYTYIFLDEAQDTSPLELDFIFDMLRAQRYFIAFDTHQTIYQFKGSSPRELVRRLKEMNFSAYTLPENFRNGRRILNYGKWILKKQGIMDWSIPARPIEGELITDMSYADTLNYIKKDGDFQNWAFLCRTNKQIEFVGYLMDKMKIPYNTFKQGEITKAQLEEKMKAPCVKLLTIHSSKGLGFHKVAVYGALWYNEDEIYLNYVAATRAMDILIWIRKEVDYGKTFSYGRRGRGY